MAKILLVFTDLGCSWINWWKAIQQKRNRTGRVKGKRRKEKKRKQDGREVDPREDTPVCVCACVRVRVRACVRGGEKLGRGGGGWRNEQARVAWRERVDKEGEYKRSRRRENYEGWGGGEGHAAPGRGVGGGRWQEKQRRGTREGRDGKRWR